MKAQHSYDYQIKKEWSQLQKIGKKKEEINNNFDEKLKYINDLRKKHYQEWLDKLLEKILAYPPFDLNLEKATPEKVFNYIVELSQKSAADTKEKPVPQQKAAEQDNTKAQSSSQEQEKKEEQLTDKPTEKTESKEKVDAPNEEQKPDAAEDIWSQTESF